METILWIFAIWAILSLPFALLIAQLMKGNDDDAPRS